MKKLSIKILIITALMLNSFLYVQAQETLTLVDAVTTALKNNYSIRIVKKTGEIAENNVSTGNAGMLPKVDASAGASYKVEDTRTELSLSTRGGQTDTTQAQASGPTVIETTGSKSSNMNASINLNWTIFDGFAMFISYEKYEAIRDKSHIEIQLAIEGTIRNLVNTYFEALKLQQQLKILKENIDISRDRLYRTKDAYELGTALKVEVYKAEVDINVDSSIYLQTKLAYKNMTRNLNYILGRNITNDFELNEAVGFSEYLDFDELKSGTFDNNTSINKSIWERKISELDYEMINSMYYPRVIFQTGYSFLRNESGGGFMTLSQSNGFNIGMNASWNLFDGNKTSIQSQNAEVNMMINDIKYDDIKKQIELNLLNAYDTYTRRRELLNLEESNLKTSEENFNRSKELYQLGQLTSIEFRDSQVNLMNAKKRINEAEYSAKIAETELLLISGTFLNK
ncbi:TolC family protein [Bacteroidota bacterium]